MKEMKDNVINYIICLLSFFLSIYIYVLFKIKFAFENQFYKTYTNVFYNI